MVDLQSPASAPNLENGPIRVVMVDVNKRLNDIDCRHDVHGLYSSLGSWP
jgi:hypothetical protein